MAANPVFRGQSVQTAIPDDLLSDRLQLRWLDLDQIEPDATVVCQLSERERSRAARFATDTLRRRYIAAHLFVRQTLASICDAPAAQLNFSENDWGKPALTDYPEIHFNLSHSQHLALLGISTVAPLGVDIEVPQHWPGAELRSLGQTIMTTREQQALLGHIDSSQPDQTQCPAASAAFLIAWTRKEACVKALGLGLSYDVRQLEVGLTPTTMQVSAPANNDSLLAACELTLRTAHGPQGAIISVASASKAALEPVSAS